MCAYSQWCALHILSPAHDHFICDTYTISTSVTHKLAVMCHISAYPLLSAYCHSVHRYKRMRLLTRVYSIPIITTCTSLFVLFLYFHSYFSHQLYSIVFFILVYDLHTMCFSKNANCSRSKNSPEHIPYACYMTFSQFAISTFAGTNV